MNNFMEKARNGRSVALAERCEKVPGTAAATAPKVQFKSSRVDVVPFISVRAQENAAWLH